VAYGKKHVNWLVELDWPTHSGYDRLGVSLQFWRLSGCADNHISPP
jgi:hypothetical protein